MKYLISISLIIIYLSGTLHTSWTLVDFYMNRDDYTKKYCQFLDQDITQCRASCYLENLLEKQQSAHSDKKIVSVEKIKITEFSKEENLELNQLINSDNRLESSLTNAYHFEFLKVVFHPPKV